MSHPTPQVTGNWAPADNSQNRLECALTEERTGNGNVQLIAIRDTFDPTRMIYATPQQLKSFADAVEDKNSQPGRVLLSAGSR